MWEYSPKIAEIGDFWYKFAQKGIPLKQILHNLAWERESQVCNLMPNFTAASVKMWAYSPQNREKW